MSKTKTYIDFLERVWQVADKVNIDKDKQGFNYTYATLKEIRAKLHPVLEELELHYYFYASFDTAAQANVYTLTVHDKDHAEFSLKSSIGYPIDVDAQKGGTQQTYTRRYLLLLMFNLLPDEDDDGAATATKAKSTGTSRRRRKVS